MIKEYLSRDLDLNKLYNTYLISVDNPDSAMNEVLEFISSSFYQHQNTITHPDFMLVQKMEGNVKNISVEQIRALQNFLNKTSIISGCKTSIIFGADQMNINAANSCLKLLEDTSKDTYIFLITNNVAAILPTIRSRCAKIKYNYLGVNTSYFDSKNRKIGDYYITPLLNTTKIDEHLSYLKAFASKDRDLWVDFTTNIQNLILRICKKVTNHDILLSPLEMQFLTQIMPTSIINLTNKYDELVKLTEDTINFDLDLRASYISLIKSMN
jgi:DNA polymerase-3 subunit delta'